MFTVNDENSMTGKKRLNESLLLKIVYCSSKYSLCALIHSTQLLFQMMQTCAEHL